MALDRIRMRSHRNRCFRYAAQAVPRAAVGDGGNVIYIDRKNRIVVAVTAHFKPMVFDRVEYIEKNIVDVLINT